MKHKILWILCLLPFASFANGSVSFDDYRKLEKRYPCTASTQLEITNMYGDVTVTNWESDSVRILVTVTAFSDELSDLTNMLNDVEVDMDHNSSFIIVNSGWSDEMGTLRQSWYDLKQNLGSGKRISIETQVWMPVYVELEIENRFGNIFLEDHQNDLEISLQHGDFRARNLSASTTIDLSYGRADIHSIKDGRLSLSYCRNARIDKAQDLILDLNSSEVRIKEAATVRIDSRHDDIRIEKIREVSGTLHLSELIIEELLISADLFCRMGDVEVQGIAPTCTSFRLRTNMTDVELVLSDTYAGNLKFDMENVRDFSMPIPEVEKIENRQDEKSTYLTGKLGAESKNTLDVESRGGYIRVSR